MPLRFADLTQASPGQPADGRAVTPAFVRSMVAILRSPRAPYPPQRVQTVLLASGLTVLRIGFAAPSPLGLLGSPQAPGTLGNLLMTNCDFG